MKRDIFTAPLAVAAGALLGATALTPVHAQNAVDMEATGEYSADISGMDLTEWDESQFDGAWQADELIEEADVYGPNGEEVGEVEDIVIGPDNTVKSVIVEGGGFWDIGDTHFTVDWDEVEIVGYDHINVPVTEETVDDYDMVRDMDDEPVARRAWRVSELINDYAALKDGERFGYVNDVLIGQDGSVKAVLIQGTSGYGYGGPYAMPYYGYDYGWGPGYDRYYTGASQPDLENVPVVSDDSMTPYWE